MSAACVEASRPVAASRRPAGTTTASTDESASACEASVARRRDASDTRNLGQRGELQRPRRQQLARIV